ncbi:MAG: DEAD/DEAH box helicase [Acidithiobacillales bacterium]
MGPALRAFEDHLSDVYFNDLPLPHPVRAGIAGCGFVRATPVQAATLPLLLAGKDVTAQAQTGTGKTAAFLITIFTRLARSPRPRQPGDPPRALVVAPTRELAVQIRDDALALGHFVDPRIVTVFGGIDYGRQRDLLRAGCDLLIGTPGRLLDYEQQGATSFGTVETLVIDEADRLFDMGFIPDLRRILRRCPPPHRRHTMLFSATLSTRVLELAWEHMNDARKIEIRPEQLTVDRVTQVLYHVGAREKIPLLLGLLRREAQGEKAGGAWPPPGPPRTLLFVNTRRFADRVVAALERHGHHVAALTGDLPQARRLRILTDFRTGKLPLLVATDVASRGLHIEGVTHVVNVDLPQDAEDYVHRIGRTARAGASGKAISLADENYVFSLAAIERLIGMKIPTEFAPEELFVWGPPAPSRRGGGMQSGGPRHLGPAEEEEDETAPPPLSAVPPASPPVSGSPETPAPDGDVPPLAGEAPDFWTREAFGLEAPEGGFAPVPALLSPGRKRRRRRRKAAATGSTLAGG